MDSDGAHNVERILEILRSYTMKKDINTRINLVSLLVFSLLTTLYCESNLFVWDAKRMKKRMKKIGIGK